ncbi:ATP-binding protein [Leifsonia virtsii]|uniref:histidine kinase n=1 Tax=Leifsonia virtsii TaxID=3035915 RepID=A0ABT8J1P8_9MICO|nr:ATP-binding protein [Leifsonia virtsii]MDN4599014.1 ATP-binding protein [Leifsonia virtsii]
MSDIAMDASLAEPTRRSWFSTRLPWWGWAVALVLIFAASILGVEFAPSHSSVAVWWPAAGLSVLLVLVVRTRREQAWALGAILLTTAVANVVAGRPPAVAAAFGLANALEALVVLAVLLSSGKGDPTLRNLAAAARFVLAVVCGAIVIGVLAGSTVSALSGVPFLPTAALVAASHAAAVLMIAPFGLLPPPLPVRATVTEMVVQAAILAGVIALVFHPSVHLSLAFVPYPVLAWASFRFPIRVVVTETLLASVTMLGLTIAGGGPYNVESLDVALRAGTAEAFLVTFSGFAIVLATAQYELRASNRRLVATSRLLSGSLVEAAVGLLIAERSGNGTLRVVWSNRTAAELLPSDGGALWDGPIADAATAALAGAGTATLPSGERTLTVAANPIPDEEDRFAVQLVDVTETLRLQAATLAAQQAQEAAHSTRIDLERQRGDFVATTSHELRTPITSIIGFCELLADDDSLGSEERSWIEVIGRNAARLGSLVEDLLTLSAADGKAEGGVRQDVDLDQQIGQALGDLSVVAAKKRIALRTEGRAGVAVADAADVGRILTNLLSNAVKFTPEGGAVTVSASASGTTATIVVSDTGPGMSEEELAHAFDRFYRAPGMERAAVPGTGLGLAIVAALVERNQGSVGLACGPGGGTRATIELVRAP